MIRGSTPPHEFTFPVNPETSFDVIQVTYMQGGDIVLTKEKSDMTFSTETIHHPDADDETVYIASYRLTQAETKLFRGNLLDEQGVPDVFIQVRALDTDGVVFTSEPMRVHAYDVLDDTTLSATQEEAQNET